MAKLAVLETKAGYIGSVLEGEQRVCKQHMLHG